VEWLDLLRGKVVGLDTAPLIYFIEEHPVYLPVVDPFFNAVERNEFTIVTSVITFLEVLVHPLRKGDTTLAQKYRDHLFSSKGLQTVVLTAEIVEEAARLRALHKILTSDAIQIATAIKSSASFFLTNDSKLSSQPGLQVLVLDELITRPSS
jgi:predicted nucleic acid-binding protein